MSRVSMLDRDGSRTDRTDQSYDEDLDGLVWEDEDDFVTVRSGGYRILRAVLALLILGAIGFLLFTGVRGWFRSQLDPAGSPGETVAVVIPSGATTGNIAQQLEDAGVIANSTFFRYYADWKGFGNFQAGEYQLQLNSSADEAVAVLKAGPVPIDYLKFGMREGLWTSEILLEIANQVPGVTVEDLLAVLNGGQLQPRYRPEGNTSWEGLLFPAFYEIEEGATAQDVLSKMNNEFARVTGELGYGAAETTVKRPAYEVIIIASMIEAEAKTDADRPRIARVIYNRLRDQAAMEIDAVCIFGSQNRQFELTGDFLESDAASTMPYPCRRNPSLPATPVAAPGRASLEAALNPSEEEGAEAWLYYVLMDEAGNHFFTADYDAFLEQKRISQEQGLF
jgi:UPF0755 protein